MNQQLLQDLVDLDLKIAGKTAERDAKTQEINQLMSDRSSLQNLIIPNWEQDKIYTITHSVNNNQYAIYFNNNSPVSYLAENVS